MSAAVEEFDALKVHFGSENGAEQITLEQYAMLLDEEVEDLIRRVKHFGMRAELRKIRKSAQQEFQTLQTGKYDSQCCMM